MSTVETLYVKNIYDEIANEFHVTRTYTWKWIDTFITSLQKNSTICDIGCGNGRNMKHKEYTFIGVDNCKQFVHICPQQGLPAIEGEMTDIPLENESVDHVICIAAFHHLSSESSRLKALMEMKRILKNENGKILLSVWAKDQPAKTRVTFENYGDNMVPWKHTHKRYYYIFTIPELTSLFHAAGLKIYSHVYDCGNEVFVLGIK